VQNLWVLEIAGAEGISKSYVSRDPAARCWRPTSIEAILAGRADESVMLGRLERPLPASWEEQRRLLSARTS
jgi:hypothetical protein